MKRDWEVIRHILITLEERDPRSGGLQLKDFPEEDKHTYSYHAQLLIAQQLVHGHLSQMIHNHSIATNFYLERLTWEGHDLLDTIRSRPVWERIKTISMEKGVELTFDSIKGLSKVALDWVLAQ